MPTPVVPIVKAVRHLEHGEWEAAHAIVQKDASAVGCWAHGIVHMLEEAFRVRGEAIRDMKVFAAEHTVERTGCALAAITLLGEDDLV
jgi:hypothetical protein